jgi:hypothetical protein
LQEELHHNQLIYITFINNTGSLEFDTACVTLCVLFALEAPRRHA